MFKNTFGRIIYFVSVVGAVMSFNSCNRQSSRIKMNGIEVPHLYIYKQSELREFLNKNGYSNFFPNEITRNSIGTTLYLHNNYSKDNRNLLLLISAETGIRKIITPSRHAYMNDQGEFIVWVDDAKNGLSFNSEAFRKIDKSGYFGVDPSGQFFFIGHSSGVQIINNMTVQSGPIKYFTAIASTNNPTTNLYTTDIKVDKIFFKDEKIYLFARNLINFKGLGKYEQNEIICQILKRTDSKFELEEEIHIPRPKPRSSPFVVIDLDPWSNNVLVEDNRDMPFSVLTAWYLFDLKSKKISKIGCARDYGFFLQEDILKPH